MENYGIGFGQIEDFKKFLIDQGIGEFDSLPEATRQEVTRDFIKPKTPTLGSPKPTPIKVSNKKPDILAFYSSDIKPKIDISDLIETSHFEVYLTAAGKNGWLLEVKTSTLTQNFPFLSKENCEKVVGFLWKDWHPYGLNRYEEKEKAK